MILYEPDRLDVMSWTASRYGAVDLWMQGMQPTPQSQDTLPFQYHGINSHNYLGLDMPQHYEQQPATLVPAMAFADLSSGIKLETPFSTRTPSPATSELQPVESPGMYVKGPNQAFFNNILPGHEALSYSSPLSELSPDGGATPSTASPGYQTGSTTGFKTDSLLSTTILSPGDTPSTLQSSPYTIYNSLNQDASTARPFSYRDLGIDSPPSLSEIDHALGGHLIDDEGGSEVEQDVEGEPDHAKRGKKRLVKKRKEMNRVAAKRHRIKNKERLKGLEIRRDWLDRALSEHERCNAKLKETIKKLQKENHRLRTTATMDS